MSLQTLTLTPALYEYLLAHSVKAHPVLKALREKTATLTMAKMQISPEQGQLMQFLIGLIGATRCIEVGVFTGYSALATALALPDDGQLIACDISEEYTAIAKEYWAQAGVSHKIDLQLRPALLTLDSLIERGHKNSFDYAFIDADKTNQAAYYERCLQLIRPNGLLVIDNTLWSGNVVDANIVDADTLAIRALNSALLTDKRIEQVMLPVGDGINLVRKLCD